MDEKISSDNVSPSISHRNNSFILNFYNFIKVYLKDGPHTMKKTIDNFQLPFENEKKNLRKSPAKSEGNDLEIPKEKIGTKSEQNKRMKGEFGWNILKKVKEQEEERDEL